MTFLRPVLGPVMGNIGSGESYSDEYQAVYDSFTTKPSTAVAAAQNTMVESLVAAGLWAKLDVFYLFAQSSNGDSEALKNWKAPGTNDATLVNAPTFTSLEGFTGDGSTSYIKTNFNLSTDSSNFTQNSASFGLYIRNDVDARSHGVTGSSRVIIGAYLTTANYSMLYNDAKTGTITEANGLYIANRTGVNAHALYKNNAAIQTGGVVSTAPPNLSPYLLAINSADAAGNFNVAQVSASFFGTSLDSDERQDIQDALDAYFAYI